MNWRVEAWLQRRLAQLPYGRKVYYLGQRLGGGLRRYRIAPKAAQGLSLLDPYYQLGETLVGKRTVEIGTGWAPLLPLLFWLLGQEQCVTVDVERLMRPKLARLIAQQLYAWSADPTIEPLPHFAQQQFRNGAGDQLCERRIVRLGEMLRERYDGGRLLRAANVRYLAPIDTGNLQLPAASFDVVFSNVVLEHVPAHEIERVFKEARRLLRPGGYMLHQVDMSDHYAHGDRSLSPINYLRFSDEEFARYNNAFLYQNRLREADYRASCRACGFKMIHWDRYVNPEAVGALSNLPLAKQYQSSSVQGLCVTGLRMVLRTPIA